MQSTASFGQPEENTLNRVDETFADELEELMTKAVEIDSSKWNLKEQTLEELLLAAIERLDLVEVFGLICKLCIL